MSSRRNLAIIALIVVASVIFLVSYISGYMGFLLTGRVVTVYVCPDGNTVDSPDMCTTTTVPTTTTTSTTTTSTTTTTTSTTTTTTLPPCSGSYCLTITSLTCDNKIITMNLTNSGPKTITGTILAYFKFFVDGVETNSFICSPSTVAPEETMKCSYPAESARTYEVEVRGLSLGNIEKGSVYCS